MSALLDALSYFTVLPVRRERAGQPPSAALFAFLPLVGALVGGTAGAAAYGVALIAPHELAVAVAFGGSIALTGALHVDGFLDSADALLAGGDAATRRAILKDARRGSFAIAYFAVACAGWLAALAALPAALLPATLAYAGGLARWSSVVNGWWFPYARGGRPAPLPLVLSAAGILGLAWLVHPWAWVAFVLVALLAAGGARWAAGRLGGTLSGDVYGALIVSGEVAALALCAALLRRAAP